MPARAATGAIWTAPRPDSAAIARAAATMPSWRGGGGGRARAGGGGARGGGRGGKSNESRFTHVGTPWAGHGPSGRNGSPQGAPPYSFCFARAAALIFASVIAGVIASGSILSWITAGFPDFCAARNALGKSAVLSTKTPKPPKARASADKWRL